MADVVILLSKEVGRATVSSGSEQGRLWIKNSVPNPIKHMGKMFAYIEIEDVEPLCAACRTSMLTYEIKDF